MEHRSSAQGILDAADRCPGEPETPNGFEDDDGCPDVVDDGPRISGRKIAFDEAIYFEAGRALIEARSLPLLRRIAKLIAANPNLTKIRVEGHTDGQGAAASNLALSKRRADAIVAFLVDQGLTAGRLEAVGYGESQPVCRERTKACHQRNRRTELQLLEIDGKPLSENK